IAADKDLARVLDMLRDGVFNPDEPHAFDYVIHSITNPHDPWMTAADFRNFVEAQRRVAEAFRDQERWTRMSILNTAASGKFSTDRTIAEYNAEIWKLRPVR